MQLGTNDDIFEMIENKKIKHDMRHVLTMVDMCTDFFQGEYANEVLIHLYLCKYVKSCLDSNTMLHGCFTEVGFH